MTIYNIIHIGITYTKQYNNKFSVGQNHAPICLASDHYRPSSNTLSTTTSMFWEHSPRANECQGVCASKFNGGRLR